MGSIKYLNRRNYLVAVQGLGLAAAQFYLPLPIVHLILCSSSIFVAIIDYFRNGVKMNSAQIQGIIIGFVGLALIINDDLILSIFGL